MNANGWHQSFLAVTDLQAVGALCGGRMRSRHTRGVLIYRASAFVIAVHSASALTVRIAYAFTTIPL